MMMVKHIENGTVIDHIAAGKALDVLGILGGPNGKTVMIGVNMPSTKQGSKDILKMDGLYVEEGKIDIIALISPTATVNVIKDGKVAEKRNVKLPTEIRGILKCINPDCITNAEREPLETRFSVKTNPTVLKCTYCNQEYDERLVGTL